MRKPEVGDQKSESFKLQVSSFKVQVIRFTFYVLKFKVPRYALLRFAIGISASLQQGLRFKERGKHGEEVLRMDSQLTQGTMKIMLIERPFPWVDISFHGAD